jgi:hypothetical protein
MFLNVWRTKSSRGEDGSSEISSRGANWAHSAKACMSATTGALIPNATVFSPEESGGGAGRTEPLS